MRLQPLRDRITMTLTALRATQRQIGAEINHFITKRLLATGAVTQVRRKSLELQQPHFKVAQHRVEIIRSFRSRFEASERHAEEIVVGLVRRREIDEQVAHVRKAGQY